MRIYGGENLTEQVLITLISFAGTLVGSLVGIFTASRLSDYRIGQLEKKVDKHNNLIERTYNLEEQSILQEEKIRVINHRINDLEEYHK